VVRHSLGDVEEQMPDPLQHRHLHTKYTFLSSSILILIKDQDLDFVFELQTVFEIPAMLKLIVLMRVPDQLLITPRDPNVDKHANPAGSFVDPDPIGSVYYWLSWIWILKYIRIRIHIQQL